MVLNQNPVSYVSVLLEVIEAFLESLVAVLSGRNQKPCKCLNLALMFQRVWNTQINPNIEDIIITNKEKILDKIKVKLNWNDTCMYSTTTITKIWKNNKTFSLELKTKLELIYTTFGSQKRGGLSLLNIKYHSISFEKSKLTKTLGWNIDWSGLCPDWAGTYLTLGTHWTSFTNNKKWEK